MGRVKVQIRSMGAAALYRLGLTDPRRTAAGALTIVTFHRVLPAELLAQYPHPTIAVTPAVFADCLDHFAGHYECRTVSDAWERLQSGGARRPLLAITFDDGQLDNLEFAAPLLAERALPATFYVATEATDTGRPLWTDRLGFAAAKLLRGGQPPPAVLSRWLGEPGWQQWPADAIERLAERAKHLLPAAREKLIEALGEAEVPAWARLMSWDEVRQLASAGHEIGCHAATHPILKRELEPDLVREILTSRGRLERELGQPVRSFAYPNGDWDEDTVQAVAGAGYTNAVTTRPGLARRGDAPFTLPRHHLDQARFQTVRGDVSKPALAWRLMRHEGIYGDRLPDQRVSRPLPHVHPARDRGPAP